MFIALYHWKIKEGREAEFREGWRRRTMEIREKCGGWGSRLHRAEDGTWFGYAQWKDKETWAAERPVFDAEATAMFRDSVEMSFPDVYMDVVDDLLLHKFED